MKKQGEIMKSEKASELDIADLLQSDTLFSKIDDIKNLYSNNTVTEINNIQENPFCYQGLYKIVKNIKCDSLHVIINSPADSLTCGEYEAVNDIMYKYLVLTGRADSVIYSIVDSVFPSISIVQLDRNEIICTEQNSQSKFFIPKITFIKDDDSINQLMTALSSQPQEIYNLSWVQKMLGWGYNRSLTVIGQLIEIKLLEQIDSVCGEVHFAKI